MKRIFALLLALMMVLSMAACQMGGEENVRDKNSNSSKNPTKATDPTEPASGEFSTGIIDVDTNTWQNLFVGIGCQLDSDWIFLSEEEIRENNENALGAMGKDYATAIKNANVFTDMMATRPNGTGNMDSMSITFEKLSSVQKLLTETKYAEAGVAGTKGSLESMGMTDVTITVDSMTFAGETHPRMNVTAKYLGRTVYEMVAIVKCGDYMVLFTACTWGTNGCQAILDQFKDVDNFEPGTTPTTPTTPTVAPGEFDTGKINTNDNKWQNTFVGMGCQLSSDWIFLSEAEIRENNEKAMNLMGKDYATALKNASVFTDMMATNSNLTDTIGVTFEKLPAGAKGWSESQYAEASKTTTKGALQSMGMSNVQISVSTITFAGETHVCMDVSAYYLGRNVYEKIAVVSCGEYMVLFAACTYGTNNCQSILDQFYAL